MKLAICLAVTLLIPACSSSRVGVANGHLDGADAGISDMAVQTDAGGCDPNGGIFVTDSDGSPCPADGSQPCHMVYPECPIGLVCDIDGACKTPCGNGNVVCDPGTLCALRGSETHDCLPQCTKAGATVYRPGSNCEARGLFLDEASGKCFVPCFYDQCLDLGDNYCGL